MAKLKCKRGEVLKCVPKGVVLLPKAHLREDIREARQGIKRDERALGSLAGEVVEGRGPVDIALDLAATADGYVRKLQSDLQYARSRAYAQRYGGFNAGHEQELERQLKHWSRVRDDAMRAAESYEASYGLEGLSANVPEWQPAQLPTKGWDHAYNPPRRAFWRGRYSRPEGEYVDVFAHSKRNTVGHEVFGINVSYEDGTMGALTVPAHELFFDPIRERAHASF